MSAAAACVMLLAVGAAATARSVRSSPANPEELMSTLGGTRNLGGQENSYGNVMPDVQMPWGFATWAPSNDVRKASLCTHARSYAPARLSLPPSPPPFARLSRVL